MALSDPFHPVRNSLKGPGLAQEDVDILKNPLDVPKRGPQAHTIPPLLDIGLDGGDLRIESRPLPDVNQNDIRGP